jgi:hypothetical protein
MVVEQLLIVAEGTKATEGLKLSAKLIKRLLNYVLDF